METTRIILTTVNDGGYMLVREHGVLQSKTHRQAFGWTERDAILAVLRQMLSEIDADWHKDDD